MKDSMVNFFDSILQFLISCTFLCSVCIQEQETESIDSAGFTTQPLSVVQAQGLDAAFECQYNDTGGGTIIYNWIINGRFFVGGESIRGISPLFAGGPVSLIVTALPKHDNITIECEADVRRTRDVRKFFLSDNAILQVQGPLDSVTNLVFDTTLLSSTSITISWTAPFSLNLTTVEPDIQYCVNVYNVTGGEDNHIHSECNITDTSYTFPASDPDQLFNFTVTPRSNVEGSLNGTTSQLVQGFVCKGPYSLIEYEFRGAIDSTDNVIATIWCNSLQNERLCPILLTIITLESIVGGYSCVLRIHPTMNSDNNVVPISNTDCPIIIHHHLYKLTIEEEYNGGSTTTEKIISTHDVQNPEVIISTFDINISCTFLNNTKDLGLFVIVNSAIDVHYFHRYRGEENLASLQITGLWPGSYNVSIYDLERDGLPQNTPAALPLSITTIAKSSHLQTDEPPPASRIKSHNATSPENGMICLTCSFSSELTGCVGVFHDAQLVSILTVLTVDYSNGVNCSNDWTEGLYSYAVFGQSGVCLERVPAYIGNIEISQSPTSVTHDIDDATSETVTLSNTSLVIIASTLGVGALCAVCLVCIAVITGILCVLSEQQRKEVITLDTQQQNEAYSVVLKMNQNQAYETTYLGKTQAVSTEPNDYEEIDLPQATESEYAEVMNIKNTCISRSL